jgi:epoxyqueuosine reductase
LKEMLPDLQYRIFVDSAPIMERQWAAKSGLGWIGKNTLLINKEKGSFFFLAEILLDIELVYDGPIKDYCGTCTKCLDACPTDAFPQPYVLDASKCISYLTIELKEELISDQFKGKFDNWVFGCDICQDVCPWNGFSIPTSEEKFSPNDQLKALDKDKWESFNQTEFNEIFSGSAVKRTKFSGLKRNISFVKND